MNRLCHIIFIYLFTNLFSIAQAETNTANQNNSTRCQNIQLQILGSGGPEIYDGLASSSYLVWINNKARVLIDAGGGSTLNFEKSGADFNDLQVILLSHLHVDHSAAIPVYIKGGFFTGRQQNLPLFGPEAGGSFPSTKSFVKALFDNSQVSVYPYLNDFINQQRSTHFLLKPQSVTSNNKVWSKQINTQLKISAINVTHGAIPALAWRVDSGECSVTFSGDMNGTSGNLPKLAKNSNILVAHNAIPEQAGDIPKYLHMTPSIIGKLAKQSQAKKLVLSHFMYKTMNIKDATKKLIRKNYQGEIVNAKDLLKVTL